MMARKYDIVEQVARERRVERIIENICRSDAPEMADFAQMIYLALLTKDDSVIERLWDSGKIDYYIVAMVQRQWNTGHSAFRDAFTKWQRKAGDYDVNGLRIVEDDDYWDRPKIERGG